MRDWNINDMSEFIDSRDIESRIDELEGERDALQDDIRDAEEEISNLEEDIGGYDTETQETEIEGAQMRIEELRSDLVDMNETLTAWTQNEGVELSKLKEVRESVQASNSEWNHGVTLIREDRFPEYVRQLCDDCGYIPRDIPSFIVIDWDETARNLMPDYDEVDIDGQTYYFEVN